MKNGIRRIICYLIAAAMMLSAFASHGLVVKAADSSNTVTFNLAGGNIDGNTENPVITIETGTTVTPPADPVRDGCSFDGWYAEGSGDKFDFTAAISEDIEITAKWICTVTFDLSGGKVGDSTENPTVPVYYGQTVDRPATDPTKDNYTFKGWYVGETEYDFSTSVEENITLTAGWEEIQQVITHTVTFNLDGGNISGSTLNPVSTVADGEKVSAPSVNPARDGYQFDGWYKDGDTVAFDFLNTPITSDIIIKAKWKRSHTVTFDPDNGNNPNSVTVSDGTQVKKPSDPTKNGYKFDGWYIEGSSTAYDFNLAVTSDLTLKAKWKKIHTVKFVSNGGTSVSDVKVVDGEKLKKPSPDPTLREYKFDGWYKDSSLSTAYNFNDAVTGDFTLYAKWSLITRFNVRDFGAKGNGTADDCAAINSALAKAKSIDQPVEIIVPRGTYIISDHLYIYSNTKLTLENGAVIKSTSSEDMIAMLLGLAEDETDNHGGYTRIHDVEITGGTWDRNSRSDVISSAIVVQHGQNINIHDLTVKNCTEHMINVSADKNVTIKNVTFTSAIPYTGSKSDFWGGHAVGNWERYQYVEALHTDFAGSDEKGAKPLDNTVCDGITAEGCIFDGVMTGIGTHHESSYKTKNVTVKNCTFKNLKYGAAVNAFSFDNINVSGNTLTGSDIGVVSVDSSGTISGNTFTTTGKSAESGQGVFGVIDLRTSNIKVEKNTIKNATNFSIKVDGGNVTVSGNNIDIHSKSFGLKFNNVSSVTINENNTIKGTSDWIVYLKDCKGNITIDSNDISGKTNAGIMIDNCSGTNVISKNKITCGTIAGICVVAGSGKIKDNNVTGMTGDGLQIVGNESKSIYSSFEITGNTFKTASASKMDINLREYCKDCVLKKNILGNNRFNAVGGVTYEADFIDSGKKDELDTNAANNVIYKVSLLPTAGDVTLNDKDAIEEARKAYNRLTDTQKAKIDATTLKKLDSAEAGLKKLQGDSGKGGNGNGGAGDYGDGDTTYSNEWRNGKWYDADGSQTYAGTLQWKCNSTGWWVEDTSGWYPCDQWQKIDGIWYYFKPDGYMAANEYYKGYWFGGSGAWDPNYLLSWKCNSTGWWVEDVSGWWPSSSWLKIDGYWYYFDGSGYMVTSQYVDGYWISADGVCY